MIKKIFIVLSILFFWVGAAYGAAGDPLIEGRLRTNSQSELTISSGSITVTGNFHSVDGESDADDTLETISGGTEGDIVYLVPASSERTIVISHATGNILTADAEDYTIQINGIVQLLYDGMNWRMILDRSVEVQAYGVRWDSTSDTYTTGIINNGDFISQEVTTFPVQEDMRRCILQNNGTVNYYLCSTDSTKKADCATAANLDGTDGQVMVEIPAFYYIQEQYGSYRYFFVSSSTFQLNLPDDSTVNAAVHPTFTKGGASVDYRYLGAYEANIYDNSAADYVGGDVAWDTANDILASVTGSKPAVDGTRDNFRDMATNRGSGWHLVDHNLMHAVQILYLAEYGDFDSQSKIGQGNTGYASWPGSPPSNIGLSNSDGNYTNSAYTSGGSASDYMTYRGIENFYGHIWSFVDGINVNNDGSNSNLYLCGNYSNYADDTATNYTDTADLAEADGYITDIVSADSFWPLSTGGSSATYLCDYYYTYFDDTASSGWRVALLGGRASYGSIAGAFCVHSYRDSSNSSSHFGGRLCY